MDGWINIDNLPEASDCYIIAWLPKSVRKRSEGCFYAIAYYDAAFNNWDLSSICWLEEKEDIVIYAWRELPEPYMI